MEVLDWTYIAGSTLANSLQRCPLVPSLIHYSSVIPSTLSVPSHTKNMSLSHDQCQIAPLGFASIRMSPVFHKTLWRSPLPPRRANYPFTNRIHTRSATGLIINLTPQIEVRSAAARPPISRLSLCSLQKCLALSKARLP